MKVEYATTEQMRELALNQLRERKATAPARVDNSSLPAGSQMLYYCGSCGHVSDIKPEDWFLGKPRLFCGECEALKTHGWIE